MILSNDFLTNIAIMWGDYMPTITLYKYAGNVKQVDKKSMLTNAAVYSGDFRDSVDLHNPDIMINDTVPADYNYCAVTVGTITRYYYAHVVNVRTGLTLVRCDIDVLTTFDLTQVPVIPARTATENNRYITDITQPVEQRTQHYNVLFSGGANLDYSNMTLIAGIVGTGGTPTNM